jgi:putative thiamine transport system substrate-binding protein
VRAARGQTVHFNAWAGSERINAYIQWAAGELQRDFGVKLQHVKITDAADVVKRVRAEKQAGRQNTEGTVDLMWINGENFAAMKRDGLLSEPFAQTLPNFQWVDTVGWLGISLGHGAADFFCGRQTLAQAAAKHE